MACSKKLLRIGDLFGAFSTLWGGGYIVWLIASHFALVRGKTSILGLPIVNVRDLGLMLAILGPGIVGVMVYMLIKGYCKRSV